MSAEGNAPAPKGTSTITVTVPKGCEDVILRYAASLWSGSKPAKQRRPRRTGPTRAQIIRSAEEYRKAATLTRNKQLCVSLFAKAEEELLKLEPDSSSSDSSVEDSLHELISTREAKLSTCDRRKGQNKTRFPRVLKGEDDRPVVIDKDHSVPLVASLMVYSPPGSGKTHAIAALQQAEPSLRIGDTDDKLYGTYDIVFTNLWEMYQNNTMLALKYDKKRWDTMCKTKCPNWSDDWYYDHCNMDPKYEIDMSAKRSVWKDGKTEMIAPQYVSDVTADIMRYLDDARDEAHAARILLRAQRVRFET